MSELPNAAVFRRVVAFYFVEGGQGDPSRLIPPDRRVRGLVRLLSFVHGDSARRGECLGLFAGRLLRVVRWYGLDVPEAEAILRRWTSGVPLGPIRLRRPVYAAHARTRLVAVPRRPRRIAEHTARKRRRGMAWWMAKFRRHSNRQMDLLWAAWTGLRVRYGLAERLTYPSPLRARRRAGRSST